MGAVRGGATWVPPPCGEGVLKGPSPESDQPTPLLGSVLPNFEVKIIPGEPYILTAPGVLGDIQLDIQAR